MKFAYQARSKEGKIEKGTIEASSKEAAASLLQKYNIYVISLKEIISPFFFLRKIKFFRKVSKKDLAIFSRQLAVMLESRVPVIQGLLSLAAQTGKADFREKIIRISELVEEGNNLSDAFSYYPNVFDIFYINLVKSGEASGKISESLYYLSDHLERQHDIESDIRGAMIYPIFVLSVLAVVMTIAMVVVLPKIVDLLEEIGGEPPLTTRVVLGFYFFVTHFGWIILIALLFLILFLVYYFRTEKGKKVYDKVLIKIPFIGGFFQKVFLVRFAENLSTLISAGLPITRAINITKNTIDNFVYYQIISEIEKGVSEGEKMSTVLVKYPEAVPLFVTQMIKVGEDTGRMGRTLMEIVNFYQKEVNRAIETFMTLIEPILIVVLGIGVALLAVAVFSPLYGMLGAI